MTLPITIPNERNYHISRADLLFKANDLGNPSCMSVIAADGASVRLNLDLTEIYHNLFNTVETDGEVSDAAPAFFDEDGNYRTWRIKGYPTYFNSEGKHYCHLVVRYDQYVDTKNPKLYDEATVVFSSHRLDLYGRAVTDDGKYFLNANGAEITQLDQNYITFDMLPVDETYFFIYLGCVSAATASDSGTIREWMDGPQYGILGTPAYLQENAGIAESDQDKQPYLTVDPEFAQFSWMGTDYADKEVTVKAEIILPSGGNGGGENAPSQPKNNVIDEMTFSVLPLLSSDTTGHIDHDVRSIVTKPNLTVLTATRIRFDVRAYVGRRTVTEFASITSSLPSEGDVSADLDALSGICYIDVKQGYDLSSGIEGDITAVTADGYSFTRHIVIRALPSDASGQPLQAQYMHLQPDASFVVRRNADGTITPSAISIGRVGVNMDSTSAPSDFGYLWYRPDDASDWTPVTDGVVDCSVAADTLHIRWTATNVSDDTVLSYSQSDAVRVDDYFVVGCFERMPKDGEPAVFAQLNITDAAPDADDADSDASDIALAAEIDITTPTTPVTPAPIIPGEEQHPELGPSDGPLLPEQPDEAEFIIADTFTVTPDCTRLYIALYELSSRKVIDSVVVPVIKDGKSVENVRPNLLRNSCFLGNSILCYAIDGGDGSFLAEEDFGGYPIYHMDLSGMSEDSSHLSLRQLAGIPLDGTVWQPSSSYVLSVWARGTGRFTMNALGAMFTGDNEASFELTDRWTRCSLVINTSGAVSSAEGSYLTIAKISAPSEETDQPASIDIACPKLELGSSLTGWCLSEHDKIGVDGDPSLSVHLSKTMIAVKKTTSIWAEEGIDPDDSLAHDSQLETIGAKVMLGPKTPDKIIDIKVQDIVGITDVQILYPEDRLSAVISLIINSDFDISRNSDMKLTFFSEHSATDGFDLNITFVPTADGEAGAQGERGDDAINVCTYTENGALQVDRGKKNTIYAEVWKGSRDVTAEISPFKFSWKRISLDPVSDAIWNSRHEACGSSVVIGDEDIFRRAMFQVEVEID